jgi:hypothetical protein
MRRPHSLVHRSPIAIGALLRARSTRISATPCRDKLPSTRGVAHCHHLYPRTAFGASHPLLCRPVPVARPVAAAMAHPAPRAERESGQAHRPTGSPFYVTCPCQLLSARFACVPPPCWPPAVVSAWHRVSITQLGLFQPPRLSACNCLDHLSDHPPPPRGKASSMVNSPPPLFSPLSASPATVMLTAHLSSCACPREPSYLGAPVGATAPPLVHQSNVA